MVEKGHNPTATPLRCLDASSSSQSGQGWSWQQATVVEPKSWSQLHQLTPFWSLVPNARLTMGKGGIGSSGFLFCRSMRQAALCQFVAEHCHQVGILSQRLDCCDCCKGIGSKPPSRSGLACQ